MRASETGIYGLSHLSAPFDAKCSHRGPLIFCILLSLFLSIRAPSKQTDLVFSGVFSIVWLGEAVVTLQIKLLGGNMYETPLTFLGRAC